MVKQKESLSEHHEKVANWIKEVVPILQKVAKGDFSQSIKIPKEKDELSELRLILNLMIKDLKESTVKLEKKVVERTKELDNKVKDLEDMRRTLLSVAQDIEREKERTQQEKNKIDTILHSIGDGVFVIDKDLKIIMINHITEKLSGFSEEELIGKKYEEVLRFVFEDDKKNVDKFIINAMKKGRVAEMSSHTVLIRKDGARVPVADSAAPLKDKDGKVKGCVVVFRDVTREREVDKAKTEFVSLASHQLRTPLSSINWYAEMLLAGDVGKLTKKQLEYMDQIYKGNQRMVELVNALLNVSRLELGTFMVEPQPTDLVELGKSVLSELIPQIDERKIELSQKFDKSLVKYNADPKLLRMIFQNLLSNAIKYTPEKGKVSLEIKKEKEGILIKVSDSGYGIPKDQQDKIFTKLFRADNVREKDTEGTGLGLYILKSIVDHADGKIWFKSIENKGTTFYVVLPPDGMKKKQGTRSLA